MEFLDTRSLANTIAAVNNALFFGRCIPKNQGRRVVVFRAAADFIRRVPKPR
jgi:hypothetical protein